ncbi:MAG: aminotransferase class IV, partial [Candidatus Omnitrophica bacterium]|nr:aminotransferase class IV [Candidatus Omnitrophota bacterium]
DRLYRSAIAIELKIPMTKADMVKAVVRTVKANNLRDGYVRLVITRGPGDLGLDPRRCKKATIFIIADKIALYPDEFYQKGLAIITARTRRNYPRSLDPRIKSLNYLNNILAKIEAIKSGTDEAIMLTCDDHVAECTGDNIFAVHGGELLTPPVSVGALEGITREAVMALADKVGMKAREKMLKMDDIYGAEEVFLTGTAAEIISVITIDGRKIGTGKPGVKTLSFMKEFKKLTKSDGLRY